MHMPSDSIIFGPKIHVTPRSYAYMTALNIFHILSAFSRSLQWISPSKPYMDLSYRESKEEAQINVSVNYIDLHIEVVPKPCIRNFSFATVFRVDRFEDSWLISLPSEEIKFRAFDESLGS